MHRNQSLTKPSVTIFLDPFIFQILNFCLILGVFYGATNISQTCARLGNSLGVEVQEQSVSQFADSKMDNLSYCALNFLQPRAIHPVLPLFPLFATNGRCKQIVAVITDLDDFVQDATQKSGYRASRKIQRRSRCCKVNRPCTSPQSTQFDPHHLIDCCQFYMPSSISFITNPTIEGGMVSEEAKLNQLTFKINEIMRELKATTKIHQSNYASNTLGKVSLLQTDIAIQEIKLVHGKRATLRFYLSRALGNWITLSQIFSKFLSLGHLQPSELFVGFVSIKEDSPPCHANPSGPISAMSAVLLRHQNKQNMSFDLSAFTVAGPSSIGHHTIRTPAVEDMQYPSRPSTIVSEPRSFVDRTNTYRRTTDVKSRDIPPKPPPLQVSEGLIYVSFTSLVYILLASKFPHGVEVWKVWEHIRMLKTNNARFASFITLPPFPSDDQNGALCTRYKEYCRSRWVLNHLDNICFRRSRSSSTLFERRPKFQLSCTKASSTMFDLLQCNKKGPQCLISVRIFGVIETVRRAQNIDKAKTVILPFAALVILDPLLFPDTCSLLI
ncbi:uncharacterized protein BDR25DRAFT_363028 [Lindgomyces ingoldianus]|uniref:Uncharacterized protein n=1 Tax=Lindgomyces ingoldianus TaxID=673940 RepID=A0ACB6Q8F3_9PLEO|nr:uncharacterized protein BDR25DRAFT_363028 [Lindgomyces ingoldianus]KAF2463304.1 hypothetical protein BDR25DRAFT_363028 [Lindgomyces ingoldianus]